MFENDAIKASLRDINESVLCFWECVTPVYSDDTNTIKMVYDPTTSSFIALINNCFWNSINIYDKCFLITHSVIKIVLSHYSRMKFLSDKKCACVSSNIIINRQIISDFNIIFSEMSILKKLCFVENAIASDYRAHINNESTMEFVFTIMLHMLSNNILPRKDLIIIDFDNEYKKSSEGDSFTESGITTENFIESNDFSYKEEDINEKTPTTKISGEDVFSQHNNKYSDINPDLMTKLYEVMSNNVSEKMFNKDFPNNEDIENEEQYLELFVKDFSKLTNQSGDTDKMGDDLSSLSSRISSSARKKYQLKTNSAKKLRLKKILQKKMLRSDDCEDEEQFLYRDEFLYGLDERIRIPSIKNIGENKKNKKNIILYVDTSGSCERFAKSFVEKVISLKFSDVKLRVFSFDDKVNEVNISGMKTNIKTTFGGTSFYEIIKHSNNLISSGEIDKHSLFLVLTDGIDKSFNESEKKEIKSKRQWYWFLTFSSGRKYVDEKCGNVMMLSDFV